MTICQRMCVKTCLLLVLYLGLEKQVIWLYLFLHKKINLNSTDVHVGAKSYLSANETHIFQTPCNLSRRLNIVA